jgi:hypothetical protein
MYTICNGCKHVLNRPRLDDYAIDEWRGECAKRHKIWANKASSEVGLFPVGTGICPDIEGVEGKRLLCTDCKWSPPPQKGDLSKNLHLTCSKGHTAVPAMNFFYDVPVTSLIRENSDFCSDYDNGNHPTRLERVLNDLLL